MMIKKTILLCPVFFFFLQFSHAQPGKIDSAFGTNGVVTTDLGFPYDYNYATIGRQILSADPDGSFYIIIEALNLAYVTKKFANGVTDVSYGNNGFSNPIHVHDACAALQSDGKIAIAGINPGGNFVVAQFNADGSLNKAFGTNGRQTGDFGYAQNVANSVAIQSDGKIIVAGYVNNESNYDFALARFNTDGTLDNTFDTDGKQTIDFAGSDDLGYAVSIQADGKIVMTGQTAANGFHDFAMVRLNANGSLDNTFNSSGEVTTDFDSSEDIAKSLVIQGDGKIVVAGYVYKCDDVTCTNAEFALARYNSDGSPDNSFGTQGKQTTLFTTGYFATAVILQPDGKILVGGYGYPGANANFAIARFNANGSIDNTFDLDGRQTTEFTGNSYANSIAIQNDGRIVAIGWDDNSTFDLARYNDDGSLDNTFGTEGKISDRLRLNQGSTFYTSTAIQTDGKILAAGYTWNGSNYDFAVARYNINGSLDNTFSDNGSQTTDFNSGDDFAYTIAIQQDGKIVVAGAADSNFALIRYNTDGSLDNTFGVSGKQTTDLGFNAYDEARSVAIQNDGKIIVAGQCLDEMDDNTEQFISDFAVAVFNSDGSPDNGFSGDGKLVTDLGYDDLATAVALQADGKIVVGGESQDDRREVSLFSVTRYNFNGTLDNTFSSDGKQFTNFNGVTHVNSIAIQVNGKILVAGTTGFDQGLSSDFALARYNSDGTADKTFSNDGIQTTHFGSVYPFRTPVLIQADGKILVGGGTSGDFTVARYTSDGSLDNEFSDDGIQITEVSNGDDIIESMAIKDNKLYAAGYGQYPGNLGVVARYFLASDIVLPVSLVDFSGELKNQTVVLNWQTSGEQNIARFVVERSAGTGSFSELTSLPGKGNSTYVKNYTAVDQQPFPGLNFYRLKMVDADEKFTYSKIVAVKLGNEDREVRVYPNPAQSILYIQASTRSEGATIQIRDISGRMLMAQSVYLTANTLYPLNISSLPDGVYNVTIRQKGKSKVQKFVKN